jgi:TonB family protein
MQKYLRRSRFSIASASPAAAIGLILFGVAILSFSFSAWARQDSAAQQPQSASAPGSQPASGNQPSDQQPAPASASASESAVSSGATDAQAGAATGASTPSSQPTEITEDEVRKILVGKQLFLRGGYLDNTLSYNEHGALIGHSPQGSYTLCVIQIDKVHLTRHKVELDGQRYGLHFLGALPYEDPTKAVDRVNITPKKKEVKITVDRELVVKPKQDKSKNKSAKNAPKPAAPAPAAAPASPAGAPDTSAAEAQSEIASAPAAERPADPKSVTTTTSPAHANKVLLDALDNVFAQPFDARMMDAMPGFWKLYYRAVAARSDYQPQDPSVLRQSMVDQKAKLVSNFEPPSNQYAQDSGVAGMSLYHVIVGADGKPGEISVARPIGFGLDESAVDAIRKASFSPAIKDGKPVPVLLDLVVEFRIYSKRTNVASAPEAANHANAPVLPGPYSVQHQ